MKLCVLPEARRDLEQSSLFYEIEGDEALAKRFESAVRSTFQWLLENPHAGAPKKLRDPRLEGLRMWNVRGFAKHLIYYRFLDDALDVVRVLHGARDIDAILLGEETPREDDTGFDQ